MHALIENGVVKSYPYTVSQLRLAYPNVSFPAEPSDESLEEYGVCRVFFSTPPENPGDLVLIEDTPIFDSATQRWIQVWSTRQKTQQELDSETAAAANQVRYERNKKISESDWTQLDDTPLTNAKKLEWATYRQALRDVPAQTGFPWQVVWPTKPE